MEKCDNILSYLSKIYVTTFHGLFVFNKPTARFLDFVNNDLRQSSEKKSFINYHIMSTFKAAVCLFNPHLVKL